MARELNATYIEPLTSAFPRDRLGPTGDVAKVNCATCHQGANKPLLGQKMVEDYVAALRP
jgi:photosynthetic reaction center cytochrome c subunit